MNLRENRNYIRVVLFSRFPTITWWGVNLRDTCVFAGDVRGLEISPGFEASVPAPLGFI